jgi:hypothetical protein
MTERRPIETQTLEMDSWWRRNVVEAAPLWAQLFRSALANVRISGVRSP